MGLVSFLASTQEVLRIAPKRPVQMLDAAARAVMQSATSTETPLTDAGLDGTGQIIQVCVCMRTGSSLKHGVTYSIMYVYYFVFITAPLNCRKLTPSPCSGK